MDPRPPTETERNFFYNGPPSQPLSWAVIVAAVVVVVAATWARNGRDCGGGGGGGEDLGQRQVISRRTVGMATAWSVAKRRRL
ncbi:hypothetical protein CSUB01_04049 [Colletotrichum sublineola]|uniref:Uncharacterized protein n=1 Tax=Colletotrichum sublineola TaxID=1173701 RepID=A0A066XD76_COLSU|nr:hypothetical protein CSUB01_04049 [Colletotrichum sublineola]